MVLSGLESDPGGESWIEIRCKQVISGACTSRSHACNLRVLQVRNRAIVVSFGQLRSFFCLPASDEVV